uniref:Transmembrane protein 107 n=1 Tax=Alexandrium monilatum TaxID=311494 RepID=A0A7S4R2F5_9DINO
MARGHWSAAVAGALVALMCVLSIVGLAAPWWTSETDVTLWVPEACGDAASHNGTCSYFQAARAFAVLTVLFGVASAAVFALAFLTGRRMMHTGMGLWAVSFVCSLLVLGMGTGINGKIRGANGFRAGGATLHHSGAGWICELLASGIGIAVGILLSFNELSWPKPPKKPATTKPEVSGTADSGNTERTARKT